MFEEKMNELTISEVEEFKRLVNYLLGHKFILELEYSLKTNTYIRNPDYSFIVSNWDAFNTYFKYGGFELENDNDSRIIYLTSTYKYTHFRFHELAVKIMYVLRLIYIEEHSSISLSPVVRVNRAEILRKLYSLGINKRSTADISSALKQLSKFNVIRKISGVWDDPESVFIIQPSINLILSKANLLQVKKSIGESDLAIEGEMDDEEESDV